MAGPGSRDSVVRLKSGRVVAVVPEACGETSELVDSGDLQQGREALEQRPRVERLRGCKDAGGACLAIPEQLRAPGDQQPGQVVRVAPGQRHAPAALRAVRL